MSYSLTLEGETVTKIEATCKTIKFPQKYNGVEYKTIGSNACYDNQIIEEIDFSETCVLIISQYAFGYCKSIIKIVLPPNIERLEGNSLYYTNIESITIPASLNNISPYALNQCPRLKNFVVDSGNTKFYTEGGFLYTDNKKTLFRARCDVNNSSEIPLFDNLTSIGGYVFTFTSLKTFYASPQLEEIKTHAFHFMFSVTTIDLSLSKITIIPDRCFWGCSATNIIFPTSLTKLEKYAFYCDDYIKYLILPASVTDISNETFVNCTKLRRIVYQGRTDFSESGMFTGSTKVHLLRAYVLEYYQHKYFGGIRVSKYEHFCQARTIKFTRRTNYNVFVYIILISSE